MTASTPDIAALVECLRSRRLSVPGEDPDFADNWYDDELSRQAAAAIEFLLAQAKAAEAENARLREALENAGQAFESIKEMLDDDETLIAWAAARDEIEAINAALSPAPHDEDTSHDQG